jgi:hypothetical protein
LLGDTLQAVSEIAARGCRRQWLSVFFVKGNRFLDDLTKLFKYSSLIVAMAPTKD